MPDFCQTMSSLERVLKAYEQAGRALPLQYQCQPAFQPVAILIAICEVPVTGSWWSQTESNRRHPACKAGALPTELWPLTGSNTGELSTIVVKPVQQGW